jgi:hypothetical protein
LPFFCRLAWNRKPGILVFFPKEGEEKRRTVMAKLLKIVTVASTAVLVGGFAAATIDRGVETQSVARQDGSVILAVAPPHTPTTEPAVDLAPSLPNTPPLPQRAPKVPALNMASAGDDPISRKLDEAMDRAVISKPTEVRSGPSEDAPMLYAFPAGRELRVVSINDGFAQIEDVRSGADGWVARSALASNMMTASIEHAKPKPVRQAKAEIETPGPVRGIPNKEWTPMLLGGGESNRAARPTGSGANFASFVRRGFGAN